MSSRRYFVKDPDGYSRYTGMLQGHILVQKGNQVRVSETRGAFVIPMEVREDSEVQALEIHARDGFTYTMSRAMMARYGVQGTTNGQQVLFLAMKDFDAVREVED